MATAMSVPIQRLPYVHNDSLRFDHHQFARRSSHRFTQRMTEQGVAWADTDGFISRHENGVGQHQIPEFANNREQLRQVLALTTLGNIRNGRQYLSPQEITWAKTATIEQLNEIAMASVRLCAVHNPGNWEMWALWVTCQNHGGFLQFLARLAYLSWSLQWDSTTIAEEMGIMATTVRQRIFRMVLVARRLGFETYKSTKGPAVMREPFVSEPVTEDVGARFHAEAIELNAQADIVLTKLQIVKRKVTYADLKAQGLCVDRCGRHVDEPGRVQCSTCRKATAARWAARKKAVGTTT